MKVKILKFVPNTVEEELDFSLTDLVHHVINEEGEYFLDYAPNEMYQEFYDYACDLVYDEEELDAHKEEIIQILINERDRLNQVNYDSYVEELVKFIEDSVIEDFDDACLSPIYGDDAKKAAYVQAIAELFNKHCGPELDAEFVP